MKYMRSTYNALRTPGYLSNCKVYCVDVAIYMYTHTLVTAGTQRMYSMSVG